METKTIEETLAERGSSYGDYSVGTKAFAEIMDNLEKIYVSANKVPPLTEEMIPIQYIVMKLVRLAATPNHIDSWHDVQGYAKLAEDMYNVTQN